MSTAAKLLKGDDDMDSSAMELAQGRFGSPPLKPKRKRPKYIRVVDCMVCKDIANDHIHYGAIACYSCRAFFRRSVNSSTTYYCSQNKTCEITVNTRKHCQYCRLQKCMDVGMKASWVMTEEDKKEKRERARIKKVAEDCKPASTHKGPAHQAQPHVDEPPPDAYTQRRRQSLNAASPVHYGAEDSLSPAYTPSETPPSPAMAQDGGAYALALVHNKQQTAASEAMVAATAAMNLDHRPTVMAECSSGYTSAASPVEICSPASPERLDVSFYFQRNLNMTRELAVPFTIEESRLIDSIVEAEAASTKEIPVDPKLLMTMVTAAKSNTVIPYQLLIEGYKICMQRIIKFAGSLDFFRSFPFEDQRALLLANTDMIVNIRCSRILRPGVNLQSQLNLASGDARTTVDLFKMPERIEYKQIFQSPWACDSEHEEKFSTMMESLFHLEMDSSTSTLMSMIVLFSSRYSTLVDKERCDHNQEFFTQLLYRYLCARVNRTNAVKLLPKYLYLTERLEEMAQILITKRLTL